MKMILSLIVLSGSLFAGKDINQKMSDYVNQGLKNDKLIKRFNDKVAERGQLKGGGPVTGWCLYWGTKIVGYGAPVVVATAGSVAVGTTTGGMGLPGAVLATNQLLTASAAATTYVAAVESTATTAGLIGLTCFWLP